MQKGRHFKSGHMVEVLKENEIASTLDNNGMLEGLPFMPEMKKYCGSRMEISMPVKKVLVEGTGYKIFDDMVLLEGASCDGEAHGGCGRMCNILWKTAWLKSVDQTASGKPHTNKQDDSTKANIKYSESCQSANLKNATARVPFSVEEFVRKHINKDGFRKNWFLKKAGSFVLFLVLKLKRFFYGGQTITGSLARTPSDVLSLMKGETVKVKTKAEILATLDKNGKNRGLGFTPEMLEYCGNRLTVLRPVSSIIDEESGEARQISNTVILENARCDGRYHAKCPRRCYLLWREMWLERV